MTEQVSTLINNLKNHSINFADVLKHIEAEYNHKPTAFKNGDVYNEATQNQGSAKVLSYARLNNLSKEDTLLLFAEHYQSVLDDPDGEAHQNIRQFMAYGWDGVLFEGDALTKK